MIPEYCIVNSVQKKCLGSYNPTRVEVKFGKLDKTKVIILKIIASLGTIATGLFSLIKPLSVRAFTGLEVAGPRGITEICAVLGGFFIALGAAPLLFRSPDMFLMLG